MATTTKTSTQDKAHDKVDQAAEAAHKGVDSAAAAAERSDEQIRQVAQQISDQAHVISEKAKAQSERVSNAVGTYTKENPVKSVGIAFLAGAVVAGLLCSKRK